MSFLPAKEQKIKKTCFRVVQQKLMHIVFFPTFFFLFFFPPMFRKSEMCSLFAVVYRTQNSSLARKALTQFWESSRNGILYGAQERVNNESVIQTLMLEEPVMFVRERVKSVSEALTGFLPAACCAPQIFFLHSIHFATLLRFSPGFSR